MANNISLGIIIGAALSGSFGSAFRSANQQATSLGRSLQQIRLGRTAVQDVDRLSQELTRLRAAQANAGAGDQALNRQIADTERQLDRARRAAERYGVDLNNLNRETNRLTNSEQRLGAQLARTNTLRRNSERRSQLGSSMLGTAGVAIGAAFAVAAPVKEAMEFESVMADVRKVADMTGKELKVLGKEIIKSSTVMPMSAAGIGAIVEAGLQSGIAKNEILGFKDAAIKMGVAFGMSAEDAGQTMASWRAGMAISQQQAEDLADAVNFLDSNMNATAASISEVIKRQGAVAKSAGLSTIQTAALSAALLNSGVQSEIAATALKNMTNALTKGDSATKAQIGVYKKLGLESKQVAKSMQADAEGTIKKVFTALSKLPKEEQSAMVGQLFGEEAKGAIMPLLVNLKALDDAFNSVGDATKYAGSMQKEYEIRSDTSANKAQLLSNKFDALKIKVGTALLPALNEVFGVLGKVATNFGNFAEKFPLVIEAVTGLSFGLLGLKLATLAAAWTGTIFSSAWVYARIAAINLITVAQWGWNAALAFGLGPIALIGAAVIGVAYLIYKNWGPISTFFSEKFSQMSKTVSVWKADITNAFTSVVNVIKPIWESFIDWVSKKMAWLGKIIEKFSAIGSSIGGAMNKVFSQSASSQTGTRMSLGDFANAKNNATLSQLVGAQSNHAVQPAIAGSGSSQSSTKTVNAIFHLTQKPGESQDQFADLVIKRLKRQEAADRRGALHD